MGNIKWNERKLKEKVSAGHGQGRGRDYQPWIHTTEVSSIGTKTRIWGLRTGRVHHLLSRIELNVFLSLEWTGAYVDIREQFPLPREVTEAAARELGYRHPTYPGTHVSAVMTTDFLCTKSTGKEIAYDAKSESALKDARTVEKLEIQTQALRAMGIQHHLVLDKHICQTTVRNIQRIRSGAIAARTSEDWALESQRLYEWLARQDKRSALNEACSEHDALHGHPNGTSLGLAWQLLFERRLVTSLKVPNLPQRCLGDLEFLAARRSEEKVDAC